MFHSFVRNFTDVLRAGSIRLDFPLLVAELAANHRVSQRQFVADLLPKCGTGAEIGVFTGLFSSVLLSVAQPTRSYFVDPWWKAFGPQYPNWGRYTDYGKLATASAQQIAAQRIRKHARACNVEILVEFAAPFLRSIPDSHFDWVYLDSTSDYEETRSQLELLRPKMKAGGIIAGDDWYEEPSSHHHGVHKAVRELIDGGKYESLGRFPACQWAIRARS